MVSTILKPICALAICLTALFGESCRIQSGMGSTKTSKDIMAAPKMLNSKWIIATRFAFLLVPMDASIAVTQVPIFVPKIMNTAVSIPTSSCIARAWSMPTEAEELCMTAVIPIPMRIPSSGDSNLTISC